jgi:hypothetical protein
MLFVWQFVLDLVAALRMTDDEKDLEIMLLRQQLRIVERKQARGPQIPRWQKAPLAALAVRVKDKACNARKVFTESVRLFKPNTLIGWHQAIVRCKWTSKQERKRGRPPVDSDLEGWILQVARDNPTLGYDKLAGELRKSGFDVGATTIRTYCYAMVFRPHRNDPGRVVRGVHSSITIRSSFWRAISSPSKRLRRKP